MDDSATSSSTCFFHVIIISLAARGGPQAAAIVDDTVVSADRRRPSRRSALVGKRKQTDQKSVAMQRRRRVGRACVDGSTPGACVCVCVIDVGSARDRLACAERGGEKRQKRNQVQGPRPRPPLMRITDPEVERSHAVTRMAVHPKR